MTSQPLHENAFNLRRPTVANFADIIKIPTIIKKTLKKTQNRLKELEIHVFKCNLYLCFLVLQSLLIFGEKILSAELKWCARDLHVFWIFFG